MKVRTKEEIDALMLQGIANRRTKEPESQTELDKYYAANGRYVWLDLEKMPFTNGDF